MDQVVNFPWERIGITGLLGIAVWALITERVVAGGAYRRVVAERDAALARLDRALHLSRRAVDVADKEGDGKK